MNRSASAILSVVATAALGCSSTGPGTAAAGGASTSFGGSVSNGGDSGAGGTSATMAIGGTSAIASVGGSVASLYCVPGATQTCVGPGACVGGQVCNGDGQSWGICDCGTGTGGATSTSSASGQSTTGGTVNGATGGKSGAGGQTTSGGTVNGATGGKSSAGTGGTTSSAVGGSLSSGGGLNSGGAASTGGTVGSGCAVEVLPVQLTQVNLIILLDKSGSMGNQFNSSTGQYDWQNCDTRWNPVVGTLKSFISDANSSRLYASLSLMPADSSDVYGACAVANYSSGTASIKVPLAALDDTGRLEFSSRLCDCGGSTATASPCIVPGGGSPIKAALQGTIDYAAAVTEQYPNSRSVIVFLSDGEPGFGFAYNGVLKHLYSCDDLPPINCAGSGCGCMEVDNGCTGSDAEVAAVAATIRSAPAKSVYVVGVGDLSTQTLQEWAVASGNSAIDLLSMSGVEAAATLRSRLDSIRSSSSSCAFDLPVPSVGSSIAPDKTNVRYTSGAGVESMLGRTPDGTSATCSSSAKSWYFDKPNAPTRIQLCPATCTAMQQDAKGQLQVVYGCAVQGSMP